MKGEKRAGWKATLAAICCHSCWGLSFLASRKGLDSANVFVLLSHRFLLSFLILHLFPRQVIGLKDAKKAVYSLLALGLAQPVVYFLGEQYGILHSTTSFSGVMIAMIPVVSTLAAGPILKERPTWGQLFFSLLSVGGVIGIGLMNRSSGALDGIGVAALLLAVLAAAVYSLLARGISDRTAPFARTYAMLGVGALVFTAIALIQCKGSLSAYFAPLAVPSYLLSLLFLSLLCSVLGFFLSSYAITKLPVARETVFSNLTTAVSVFAGVVFLDEPFSWFSAVCILLILVGIWGVQRTAEKANHETNHMIKGESDMNEIYEFLKQANTYYLATVEGDQPRVRPFGTVDIFEGKLYIQTGKVKPVSNQLHANPKAELCAFLDGRWIRVSGELIPDERIEAKKHMLDNYPMLRSMYDEQDGNTEVFYFQNGVATFSSFTEAPRTIAF